MEKIKYKIIQFSLYFIFIFLINLFHVLQSLPDELGDLVCDVDIFKQFFKTILISFY